MTGIATVVIAVLTWFISSDSSGQLKAISTQAETMQRQLDELKAEQRPWVGIYPVIVAPLKVGDPFRINIGVMNNGHKPAFNLVTQANATPLAAGLPPPSEIVGFTPDVYVLQGKGMVLLPGAQVAVQPVTLDIAAIDQITFDRLQSGELQYWVTVLAEYADDDQNTHVTTLRAIYFPSSHSLLSVNPGNKAN